MPRRERQVRTQSLVASARNVSFRKSKDKARDSRIRSGEQWHHDAWDFYDIVPEYHQGCAITGALLSRAKLIVNERQTDGTWAPTQNAFALEALRQLAGGEEGQVEMLRNLGIHFSVVGGAHLVGPQKEKDLLDPTKWLVVASTEITKSADTWRVNGKEMADVWAIELWKPHPRDHRKYDAPTRAILPILSELVQLTKRQAAQIDSRLTGNGLVLFASEVDFPSTPVRRNPGDPSAIRDSVAPGNLNGLVDTLVETGSDAMQDQSSPAAQLPVFGTVPGEFLGKSEHIKFWSELDAAMPAMRLEQIRRIALGMDMPPEVLLGNAGSNHWNAWLSDENSVKIHAEPLLRIITSSLTVGYLHTVLEGVVEDVSNFAIGADTSQMRMRPNRSKEAMEALKLGELSPSAMRRENGFDEADAPTEEERRQMLLWRVANGSTTPELVDAALKEAGVDLGVSVTDLRAPAQARPLPSTVDHPVREIPQRTEDQRAAASTALVYAAEQMVDRALQRAGNKMKSKYGMRSTATPANRLYMHADVAAADLDTLLDDAWGCTQTTADLIEPQRLARALDIYTRSVITARREPTRGSLAAALKLLLDQAA